MFAGLASLVTALAVQSRSSSDTVESVDLERQFDTLLADDGLCGCQLAQSPPINSGPSAHEKSVTLRRILTSCEDSTKTFAAPGSTMRTQSGSFVVERISVRDLIPTGRHDATTGQPDQYTGSFLIEFRNRTVGRTPRPLKAAKIFSTTPDGRNLMSCASATGTATGPMVPNSAMTYPPNPAVVSCPDGYSIVSGGWKLDYRRPLCPSVTNGQYPFVSESRPVVGAHGRHGWRVVINCVTASAIALCQRGHN